MPGVGWIIMAMREWLRMVFSRCVSVRLDVRLCKLLSGEDFER